MKLWLDDLRLPPDESWTWVKTVADAQTLMASGEVCEASLDHDLGLDANEAELPAGRTLVLWMAEHDLWPSCAIAVHSANPVGAAYMAGVIERYSPLVRAGSAPRFVRREEIDDGAR